MLSLSAAPASEPVTSDEAKLHLKVENSTDDALIAELIKAARQMAETFTGRGFITQTWILELDGLPRGRREPQWEGVREGSINHLLPARTFIDLGIAPVSAITAFKYFDLSDTEQDFSSDNYFLDSTHTPPRVALNQGQSWPTGIRPVKSLKITMTVGYGDASSVPSDIKVAIKQILSHLYENRGDGEAQYLMPLAAKAILDPYILRRL